MKRKLGAVAAALTLVVTTVLAPSASQALPGPTFDVDARSGTNVYENTYSSLIAWSIDHWWSTGASSIASNFYSTYYPELKEVELFYLAGGCYTGYTNPITCGPARDLFVDPTDTTTMTDYDFDSTMVGLGNIVRQGLTPVLKVGNQPIKFSSSPHIGVFGVNTSPPDDYTVWYDYLNAFVDRAVADFGLSEVRSWKWSVLSEYENLDVWRANDGTAASSKAEYFKLYDWTSKAIVDALGAGHARIGAHAQGITGGAWDYRDLLDHVTSGANVATGGTGAPMTWMGISFYDNSPTSLLNFSNVLSTLRTKIDAVGLNGLPVGIDEGSMFAPDGDVNGEYPTSFQSALNAWRYQIATDYDVTYWGRWGLSTDGVYSYTEPVIVNPVGTNFGKLVHKMSGSRQLSVAYSGAPTSSSNQVSSYSGYDAATNTLWVMMFNRSNSPSATTAESVLVNINHVANSSPVATKYQIDDTHANFYPTWAAAKTAQGIGSSDYATGNSVYNWLLPYKLVTPSAVSYWNANKSTYASLSALNAASASSEVSFTSSTATISTTLPAQGVALYKITGITVIP